MSLETYIQKVDTAIEVLTHGVFGLNDLPDLVDIAECWEWGMTVREAAIAVLNANGYVV